MHSQQIERFDSSQGKVTENKEKQQNSDPMK
jgi:hypothetical protein